MLASLASESKASFEEAEGVESENPNKELIEDNGVVVGIGGRVDDDEEGVEDDGPKPLPKGIRGVYQMRTAKKNVCRYQVRVWIKRGQIKSNKGSRPWEEGSTKGRRASGKRVHLGCFGTLETSTHAFDVAEIFFKGKYATTNVPVAQYENSPILQFLLSVVEDRTDLEEFMTVWKHLMQYRWVFDYREPDAGVTKQLLFVKEKIDKYKERAATRKKLEQSQLFGDSLQAPPVAKESPFPSTTESALSQLACTIPTQNGTALSDFLTKLMHEKQQQAFLESTMVLKRLTEMPQMAQTPQTVLPQTMLPFERHQNNLSDLLKAVDPNALLQSLISQSAYNLNP